MGSLLVARDWSGREFASLHKGRPPFQVRVLFRFDGTHFATANMYTIIMLLILYIFSSAG
jgi:hypothetical protein